MTLARRDEGREHMIRNAESTDDAFNDVTTRAGCGLAFRRLESTELYAYTLKCGFLTWIGNSIPQKYVHLALLHIFIVANYRPSPN